MSNKRRRAPKSRTKPKSEKAPKKNESKKVEFKIWFDRKVREDKLKFWQENEIKTAFSKRGLSDKEEPEKYEKALKLY